MNPVSGNKLLFSLDWRNNYFKNMSYTGNGEGMTEQLRETVHPASLAVENCSDDY